jgi:hypothetical protein
MVPCGVEIVPALAHVSEHSPSIVNEKNDDMNPIVPNINDVIVLPSR